MPSPEEGPLALRQLRENFPAEVILDEPGKRQGHSRQRDPSKKPTWVRNGTEATSSEDFVLPQYRA